MKNGNWADFDEAYEILEGRIYEIHHANRTFRVYVEEDLTGRPQHWRVAFDELVYMDGEEVWVRRLGIPEARAGATAEDILGQAAGNLRRHLAS